MASKFPEQNHEVDFCVIGGGMAGICAALAAARHGAKVLLMQERPVLGGNSSSECRVHVCGADRSGHIPHLRETGILEELRLDNLYHNHQKSFSIWDTVLYDKINYHPNITLLLNCSCIDATMTGSRILNVKGWQMTTQTYHIVTAPIFADCSGDAILAPLTGAEFRVGREARDEFGESIAPEKADLRTMGMTCLFHAKEHDAPQPFEPPAWAYRFDNESDVPRGAKSHGYWHLGYWWVELGGEQDSIRDTEKIRDELLKIVYGLWDHIKNRGEHGAENWALEWVQFLPGKRESRRYVGDHVLTQLDVEAEGRFDDRVAYGGWTMDDHHPAGFWAAKIPKPPTVFHPAPSPYGIPYRCLYSKNIDNLMFAGRNASCTHAAMSSSRVMGTGSTMGQAIGTAAALAAKTNRTPREVGTMIGEIQRRLQNDDAYIPWMKQEFPKLTTNARLEASSGDPEPVRDGFSRQVGDDPHCWIAKPGESISYLFKGEQPVDEVTLVLDSDMEKRSGMTHFGYDPKRTLTSIPEVMPKVFRLEGLEGGEWTEVARVDNNYQRLVKIPLKQKLEGVRFVLDETWGADESRVYAFTIA